MAVMSFGHVIFINSILFLKQKYKLLVVSANRNIDITLIRDHRKDHNHSWSNGCYIIHLLKILI